MSRTRRKAHPLFRHPRGVSDADYRNCSVAKGYDDCDGRALTRTRRRVWKFAARRDLAHCQ